MRCWENEDPQPLKVTIAEAVITACALYAWALLICAVVVRIAEARGM